MNTVKTKSKQMTAFRFARLHNIPIRNHWEWKDHHCFSELSYRNQPQALFISNSIYNIHAISLDSYKSQTLKECAIWHEIGHYLDSRQIGIKKYYDNIPIFLREARASMKAITLMKKYGRWEEYKRDGLLEGYDTYLNPGRYSNEKNYRHLIEEA